MPCHCAHLRSLMKSPQAKRAHSPTEMMDGTFYLPSVRAIRLQGQMCRAVRYGTVRTTKPTKTVHKKRPGEALESIASDNGHPHLHTVEVYSIPCGGLNGHFNERKVRLPPGKIVVEVQEQRAKASAANEIVEGFHVVGVQLKEAARFVPCHLSDNVCAGRQKKVRRRSSKQRCGVRSHGRDQT